MADVRIEYADDPEAIGRIREYLRGIDDDVLGIAAGLELRKHFERLAADPGLGTAPTGPFESRRIHRFMVEASGVRRLAQVSYMVRPDSTLVILAFSCAKM